MTEKTQHNDNIYSKIITTYELQRIITKIFMCQNVSLSDTSFGMCAYAKCKRISLKHFVCDKISSQTAMMFMAAFQLNGLTKTLRRKWFCVHTI